MKSSGSSAPRGAAPSTERTMARAASGPPFASPAPAATFLPLGCLSPRATWKDAGDNGRPQATEISTFDLRPQFRDVAQPGSAPEWGSGGRGFKSRRPDGSKRKLRNHFGCGAFSYPMRRVVSCVASFSGSHQPLRRLQHHSPDRLGVHLLVAHEHRRLVSPATGRRDVLHRIALPLRGPLPAE